MMVEHLNNVRLLFIHSGSRNTDASIIDLTKVVRMMDKSISVCIKLSRLINMYSNLQQQASAYQICREEIDRLSNIPSEGILSCTE